MCLLWGTHHPLAEPRAHFFLGVQCRLDGDAGPTGGSAPVLRVPDATEIEPAGPGRVGA